MPVVIGNDQHLTVAHKVVGRPVLITPAGVIHVVIGVGIGIAGIIGLPFKHHRAHTHVLVWRTPVKVREDIHVLIVGTVQRTGFCIARTKVRSVLQERQ